MDRLLAFTAVVLFAVSGEATAKEPFGQSLAAAGRVGLRIIPKGVRRATYHLIHGDPMQLGRAEWHQLARRTVNSYFREAQGDRARALEELDLAVRKYAYNHAKVSGRSRQWRREENLLLSQWEKDRAAIAASANLGMSLDDLGEQTVEQLLWRTYRDVKDPPPVDPWNVRLRSAAARTASWPFRLVGRGFRSGGRLSKLALASALGTALIVPFVVPPTQQFTQAPSQYVEMLSNVYLGDVNVKIQGYVTTFDFMLRHASPLASLNEVFKIAERYQAGTLSKEEAFKLYLKNEQALMLLRKNVAGVAPPGVKEARNELRDLTVVFFNYANFMETVHGNLMNREAELAALKKGIGDRPPTAEEQTQMTKLETVIAAGQERLGLLLALYRVNQILYPEYTRLNEAGDSTRLKLLNTYNYMVESMNLQVFFQQSRASYVRILSGLGIPPEAQTLDHVKELEAAMVDPAAPESR